VPHVVLEGPVTLAEVARRHQPSVAREGDLLVKTERLYVDTLGRAGLLETLVVDRGHTQKFFLLLEERSGGMMLRLEPLTDPEKSPGVKRALGLVALRIREATGCRFGSTNIPASLSDPAGPGGNG
jgi:hypothetical protein